MISEAIDRRVYQLPLPHIGARTETYIDGRRQYFKEIDSGSKGLDILQAILARNESITHVGVIAYDLSKNSDKFHANNPEDIVWIATDNPIYDSVVQLNQHVLENEPHKGIAICSSVRLSDGSVAHIPMMDCASENDIDKDTTREWLRGNGLRGYYFKQMKLPRPHGRGFFSLGFFGSEIPPKRKYIRIHPRSCDRGFLRRGINHSISGELI